MDTETNPLGIVPPTLTPGQDALVYRDGTEIGEITWTDDGQMIGLAYRDDEVYDNTDVGLDAERIVYALLAKAVHVPTGPVTFSVR